MRDNQRSVVSMVSSWTARLTNASQTNQEKNQKKLEKNWTRRWKKKKKKNMANNVCLKILNSLLICTVVTNWVQLRYELYFYYVQPYQQQQGGDQYNYGIRGDQYKYIAMNSIISINEFKLILNSNWIQWILILDWSISNPWQFNNYNRIQCRSFFIIILILNYPHNIIYIYKLGINY